MLADAHCVASVVLFSAWIWVVRVTLVIQVVTTRPTTNTIDIINTEARNAEIPFFLFITNLWQKAVYIIFAMIDDSSPIPPNPLRKKVRFFNSLNLVQMPSFKPPKQF